jgi:hypothetical protein
MDNGYWINMINTNNHDSCSYSLHIGISILILNEHFPLSFEARWSLVSLDTAATGWRSRMGGLHMLAQPRVLPSGKRLQFAMEKPINIEIVCSSSI